MREQQIYAMHQAGARRDALILGQFEFMRAELDATRRVLLVASFMDRVKFLIWPKALFATIDAVMNDILERRRQAMQAAAAKPNIVKVPTLAS